MEKWILIFVGAVSAAALLLYAIDKLLAKLGGLRIPEKWLLVLGLLGGAPGAMLGMLVFRHKTRKWYFWAINLTGLPIVAGLLILFLL